MVAKKHARSPKSMIAQRFGIISKSGEYKPYHKKREAHLKNTNRSELYKLTFFLSRQCAVQITPESVAIANACKETLKMSTLPLTRESVSRHMKLLVTAAVDCLSGQFEISSTVSDMLNVIMDTLHVLLQKHHENELATSFAPELVATFVEMASCSFLTASITKSELGSCLSSMLNVDLSLSLCDRDSIQDKFCVCLNDLLTHWLYLVHAYVSRYDPEELRETRSSLLGSLMVFKHLLLVDNISAFSW